jgi:molybdate transport system ATP-binding protein
LIRLQHKLARPDFDLDVDVEIPATGVTGIFGASGSGKTTLLRCIAGLERGSSDDRRPPQQRRIGYVFQSPGLFPHLDVRGNVEYGLRRNPAGQVDRQQVIDMLGLGDLLDRDARSLSGGEAQRVAIAAALLRGPALILLDEPLSSLDQRRKDELLPYFDRLRAELSVPMIYVSHDIAEVSRLCDHLLLMDAGRIIASGELHEVLLRADLPMLGGRNAGAIVDGLPVEECDGLTCFRFDGGDLWVPGSHPGDQAVRLRIAASDVSLCRDLPRDTTILNVLAATVEEIRKTDTAVALVRVRIGETPILAQVTNRSIARLNLVAGDEVFAQIKSVTVRR